MTTVPAILGNRYRLGTLLGQGGMGAVYQAWDPVDEVDRAVKLLPAAPGGEPSLARRRFESEGQMLTRLDHPNVIRVFDVGLDAGFAYMVMELAEGGSPVDWLARHGPMPPRVAVEVALQIACGLREVHAHGLVHRDVKPSNVLVDRNGVCKLADFGVARNSGLDDGLTRTGAVFGTLGYMAPEQRRNAKQVDARADVYGLAATLHTLLTDRVEMDLFAFDPQPEILRGVPDELIPLLKTALWYAPDGRIDMATFAAGLEALLPTLPPVPPGTATLAVTRVVRPSTINPTWQGVGNEPTLPPEPVSSIRRQRTALIVEDDDMLLRLAQFVLADMMGFRVMGAPDGAHALRISDNFDGFLDVVLTDLVMPGQSGAQVAVALTRARPGLKVVYMSAHSRNTLSQLGMEPVGGALLPKPFTPQQLVAAIEQAVGP